MRGMTTAGRIMFAIAMIFFGVQFVIFAASMAGPVPGPPWTHGSRLVAWVAAVGFVVAGVSIASGKMGRVGARLLGACLLVYALFQYLPTLIRHPHDPGPWTVVFEILAMTGGAWVLAASFPANSQSFLSWGLSVETMANIGRYLIAISLVVFAVQHFIYAGFVASLVPAWMPWHLFWAYFTGLAFVAAALAIAANKMMGVATMLLGTMFLLWVVVLHVPRVAGAPRDGNEVTSLFVALAMSGVGFILAGAIGNRLEGRRV